MGLYEDGVFLTRFGTLYRCCLDCGDEKFTLRISAVANPITGYFTIMKQRSNWILVRILKVETK